MRNPKRIPKILKVIEKIWQGHPYLRLCQLIQNCFGTNDIYYIEDDELIEALTKHYENKENNSKETL